MNDCVARVAALATKTTVEEFNRFCATFWFRPTKNPPHEELHLYAYLLHHGFFCGYRLGDEASPVEFPDLPVSELRFIVDVGVSLMPAYVKTIAVNPSWDHAVYWNGSHIIDPNRDGEHHPSEYRIKCWTPIYRL